MRYTHQNQGLDQSWTTIIVLITIVIIIITAIAITIVMAITSLVVYLVVLIITVVMDSITPNWRSHFSLGHCRPHISKKNPY